MTCSGTIRKAACAKELRIGEVAVSDLWHRHDRGFVGWWIGSVTHVRRIRSEASPGHEFLSSKGGFPRDRWALAMWQSRTVHLTPGVEKLQETQTPVFWNCSLLFSRLNCTLLYAMLVFLVSTKFLVALVHAYVLK